MAGEWSQAARGVLRAVRAVRAVQAAVPQRGAGARSVPPGLQAPWQSKSPLDAQARSGLAWGRRRSLGALSWPPQSAWLAMHAAPARERGLRSSAVVCTPAEPSAGGSKRHSAVVDVLIRRGVPAVCARDHVAAPPQSGREMGVRHEAGHVRAPRRTAEESAQPLTPR